MKQFRSFFKRCQKKENFSSVFRAAHKRFWALRPTISESAHRALQNFEFTQVISIVLFSEFYFKCAVSEILIKTFSAFCPIECIAKFFPKTSPDVEEKPIENGEKGEN